MSIEQEKIVARFVRQEQGSKSIVKYVLAHAQGKGARSARTEVETYEISEALAPEDADSLASTMHARAQMDADGLGPSLQRYVLTSFEKSKVEGDKPDPSSRCTFRVKGNSDIDLDEEDENEEGAEPSMKGLTSQLMRHNEQNNRTMVGSWGSMLTHMARQMESRDKMIETMYAQRQKDFEAIERARSEEATRQLEFFKEQQRQARFDMAMKKGAQLAPVLLNHLTGGKLGGTGDSVSPAVVLMLKEFKESLSEEQLMAIASKLQPAQAIALMEIVKSIPKHEDGEREPKKLEEGKPDAEMS